jgi:hypothetical protein
VIELISPLGYPNIEEQAERKRLGTAVGRRLGFIWNQYQTTRNFWPRLERSVENVCSPQDVKRAYKENTWTPLDKARFAELTAAVELLVVGVGA